MRALRVLALVLATVPVLASAYSIDQVIGVYTFTRNSPAGFENGFLRFDADHAFVLVSHLDVHHVGIPDKVTILRGQYEVKRKDNGEPGIFLAPEGEAGQFIEDPRGDGVTTVSFCALSRCFTRKSENAPYFDDSGNKPSAVGKVNVATTPAGAIVFVDGKRQPGTTPLLLEGLAAGFPHTLRIERTGFQTLMRTVTPQPNQEVRLELALPTGKEAFLVRSVPATNVLVDGDFVGRTPTEGLTLAAGSHTITLRNDGAGVLKTFTVDVKEGKPYERMFKFMGKISIDVGAPVKVFAGDVDLGAAPLKRVSIPAGIHMIRLAPQGGKPVTVNVRIVAGVESKITGTMEGLSIDQPTEAPTGGANP